jgi:hypothetical protein
MECPNCEKVMRKVRWEITNNFKVGKDFREFDKVTYECKDDDIWITTEIPMVAKSDNLTTKISRGNKKEG